MHTSEQRAVALENADLLMQSLEYTDAKLKGSPAAAFLMFIHSNEGTQGLVNFIDRLGKEHFAFTPAERRFLPIATSLSKSVEHLSRRELMKVAFATGFMAGNLPEIIDTASTSKDTPLPNTPDEAPSKQIFRSIGSGLIGGGIGVAVVDTAFLYRDRNAPPTHAELEPIIRTLNAHIARALGPAAPSR